VRRSAAATKRPDGRRVIDDAWVQWNLARVRAKLDVLKLLNWKQAWSMTRGNLNFAEASTVKVFGSELNVAGYQLLPEVVGEQGALKRVGGGGARRPSERMYKSSLTSTFGGGTNEVQRDIIAMAGRCRARPLSAVGRKESDGLRVDQESVELRELAHKILADHVTQESQDRRVGTEWLTASSGARAGEPDRPGFRRSTAAAGCRHRSRWCSSRSDATSRRSGARDGGRHADRALRQRRAAPPSPPLLAGEAVLTVALIEPAQTT
jgi:hypothetical protein